jgi:hypothetical protein
MSAQICRIKAKHQGSAEVFSTSGGVRQQWSEYRHNHKAASPKTQSQIVFNKHMVHHSSGVEEDTRFRDYNAANTADSCQRKSEIRPGTAEPLQSSMMNTSLTRTVIVPFSRQVSDVDQSDDSSQQHRYGNKTTDATSCIQLPRGRVSTARPGSGVGGLCAGKAAPAVSSDAASGASSSEGWLERPLLSQSCRFARSRTLNEQTANSQGARGGSEDTVTRHDTASLQDEPQLVSDCESKMSAHRLKHRCSSSGNSRYVQCKDVLYYKIPAVPSGHILLPAQRSSCRSARRSAVSVATRPGSSFTQHSNPEFQMKDYELLRHDYSNNILFEGCAVTDSSDGY